MTARRPRTHSSPREGFGAAGWAAIILAGALGVGWCASLIIAALPITHPISSEGAQLLNGIGQVLAGAVATFLGSQILTRRPAPEPTDDQSEELTP